MGEIHKLAGKGQADALARLIQLGANVDERDSIEATPLFWACVNNQIKTASVLVTLGADVNARNNGGRTPLMGACRFGHIDSVRTMLDAGAAVDARDNDGETALMISAGYADAARPDIIEVLLDAGAEIDARSHDGSTPLILAAGAGHLANVQVLLLHDARTDLCNHSGRNALEQARWRERADVVAYLVLRQKSAGEK